MISIFDGEINVLYKLIDGVQTTVYEYDSTKALPTSEHSELVLMRDAAFELGGSDKPCVCATVVSDTAPIDNKTIVIGKELADIREDCSYAKIVLIGLKDSPDDEQGIFDLTKALEYSKYKENVQGFMTRVSALSQREQVRVSKTAIKHGLSFEKLGATVISGYLAKDAVKSVTVLYVADSSIDFDELQKFASKTSEILKAFNHILDNVLVDCAHCNLREICDEVEGMKELHFRNSKMN